MRIQLSISLLISDKIHAIRKCLDSLVPILMQIPSELIIIHTTEDEEIRNLALRYTDQVIQFQWCDDFSKARNVGLEAAQGEWFMYIDDDEWLEDSGEIVTFFTSGEYRAYNSATYVVRNYTQWAGTDYIDAHVGRMICRTPEVRFSNAVHEYIGPFREPTKVFSVYVHHYGYVRNIIETKTNRNLILMQKELREHVPTVHNYLQICQEYMSDLQYAEAEKYAYKCLELDEDGRILEKSWCVAFLPFLVRRQGDEQRAFEVGKQMLRHPCCTEIAALRIYLDMIAICEELEHHEKNIIIYARTYHQNLAYLDARPEQWTIQSIGGLHEHQSKSLENSIYMSGLVASIQIKDAKSAQMFLQWFPWESREIEKIYPWFFNLLKNGKNKGFIQELFAELDIDDPFIFMVQVRAAWDKNDPGQAQTYYTEASRSKDELILHEAVLLFFRSQGGLSLESWMDSMDARQWRSVSEYAADQAEVSELSGWITAAGGYLERFPIQALSMLMALQKRLLIEGVLETSEQELFEGMEQYCRWMEQYACLVYNEEKFLSGEVSLIPQDCRFALQMGQVFRDLQEREYQKVLQGLHQAINISPVFCGAVRRMLSVIEGEMQGPGQAGAEFEVLGMQVKKMVQDLLREGRVVEAFPLVQQLSSILPWDLEVLRLRQRLWMQVGE